MSGDVIFEEKAQFLEVERRNTLEFCFFCGGRWHRGGPRLSLLEVRSKLWRLKGRLPLLEALGGGRGFDFLEVRGQTWRRGTWRAGTASHACLLQHSTWIVLNMLQHSTVWCWMVLNMIQHSIVQDGLVNVLKNETTSYACLVPHSRLQF